MTLLLQVSSQVDEAVEYLEGKLNNYLQDDYYALALTAYALCLADSSRAEEALDLLDGKAIMEGTKTYLECLQALVVMWCVWSS